VLLNAQERTVSRKEILRRVWSMNFEPGTNFIQVHVSRLRSKLGAGSGFEIKTVRGQGYRLVSCAASS
jgi:two-component system OmpR family response regulator